jgi:hypothetical protein
MVAICTPWLLVSAGYEPHLLDTLLPLGGAILIAIAAIRFRHLNLIRLLLIDIGFFLLWWRFRGEARVVLPAIGQTSLADLSNSGGWDWILLCAVLAICVGTLAAQC